METVYQMMATTLSEHFGVPEDHIHPDATFEELDVDSLARAEMLAVVEGRLKVTLDQEPGGLTLGEAAARIERLLAGGTGGAASAAAPPPGTGPASLPGPLL
ncbi:acyl carrier protein [Streptomyces morookaense]|uniref:acyl carrier protein n=1 Tax=Streptomyces morookaense TaxID=1970 RepID=UPI0033C89C7B